MSKHSLLARDYFHQGYNCSQSVVLAFSDLTGLGKETALKISSSFGGGMGKLREVCGAVTGAFIVLGLLEGYTDPEDREVKQAHYQRIHDLGTAFRAEKGSYLCRDLLAQAGQSQSDTAGLPASGLSCAELVEHAAVLVDAYLESENQ